MPQQTPEHSAQRDRRARHRHQSASTSALATVAYAGRTWRTRVRNVSSEGVSLQAPEPVPVGSLVTVCLSTKSDLFARTLEVRVLHAHALADGRHVFGGNFGSARLAAEEVTALLCQPRLW